MYLGVEKAGLVVQLESWFGERGVPILALGGYSSQSYVSEILGDVRTGRAAVLLYAGDFDPTGEDIDRDFVARTGCWDQVVRVALSAEQVTRYRLPPNPGMATDSRAAGFVSRYGQLVQAELDALLPETLRSLFADAIAEYWDEYAYADDLSGGVHRANGHAAAVISELFVPVIATDTDALTAALAYAAAGWYVGPARRGSKHPGSVLGNHWQTLTSRDPKVITAWFAGTDCGVYLHCGRSGAVVFDVDNPAEVPSALVLAIQKCRPPFQSTRNNADNKGHYVFATPPGRCLGNGTGRLGTAWGEVRGRNGVIMVAPSVHEKAAEGGCYQWLGTGVVPVLPDELATELPDSAEAVDAATDAEVREFRERHIEARAPCLLSAVLKGFQRELRNGGSRHDAMVTAACWAARESRAGAYSATVAFHRLSAAFVEALATPRSGSSRTATRSMARHEFAGIAAWAVAQANAADIDDVRRKIEQRIPDYDVSPPDEPPEDEWADADGEHSGDPWPADEAAGRRVYDHEVAAELRKLRVRDAARRALRAEQAGTGDPPTPVLLSQLLAEPEAPTHYRVAGLLPVGGRVVLAAQFKAGKTTLTGNLIRSLVDGEPFLGEHEVTSPVGRVVLLDTEMSRDALRRWLRDQGIGDASRVAMFALRGRVASLDLLDPPVRQWWARQLAELDTEVLILDCLRPVLDAFGLDENTDVGQVLVALDELVTQAGVDELFVVHHMGHVGERSRGSSRLRDWPDVEWRLVRENADDPASRRFFSAYGRDVEVPESALDYDPGTRHLTVAGGSRQDAAADAVIPDLLRLLIDQPGLSGRDIAKRLTDAGVTQKLGRVAVKRAIDAGYITMTPGPGRAHRHHATASGQRFAQTSRSASESVCAGDAPTAQDHHSV